LQAVPSLTDHELLATSGLHIRQLFEGLVWPAGLHVEDIRHQSAITGNRHVPSPAHESVVQDLPSKHVYGVLTQFPETQWSSFVQLLASLQGVLSSLRGLVQIPVEVLQMPASWQSLTAGHVLAVPP
jgi:hypothetical protein